MGDLYDDGRHYDALLGGQLDDLDFYLSRARQAKGPVLELACGTGRLTLPLAKAGIDITGLDRSEAMLARGREKAAAEGLGLTWILADIRHFDLKRRFNLIFLPYNSMQHLHERSSLEALFGSVRAHLTEGGRFIVDVHQPSLDLLNRRPHEIYTVEGLGAAPDETVVTGEEVSYEASSQIYRIRWHYSAQEEEEPRQDELQLRMFFPQELDALLHYNGFKILEKWGDFKGTCFGPESLKQVVVCCAL